MEEQKKRKSSGRGWAWISGILLFLIFIAATACFVIFRVNQFSFEVLLHGGQEQILEFGEQYQESGAYAVLSGTLFWKEGIHPEKVEMMIHTDLQEERLGIYTVTYTATLYNWTASAQRMVRVVDTQPPTLILLNPSGSTILPGMPYEEEGYIALDNYDGNITDRVRRIEDTGRIVYVVADSSGNPASAEREIPYYDPLPPEIHLVDGDKLTITAGTVFEEPGFHAWDNADGDVTDRVFVAGEVCWYKPGIYTLTYSVSDVFENTTTVHRSVEVQAVPRPETVWPRGKVIYLTFDDGPGPYTDALLDTLSRYGVKATFFVTDTGYYSAMAHIVKQGHSIGIHTASHDYREIYASPEAYFMDLHRMQEVIYRNTGVRTSLLRFPGGGSNMVSSFNPGIMTTLTEAVQDAGFRYFDWNVDSMDAGGANTAEKVKENVLDGVKNQRVSVVLQHDIHGCSVEAVEDIILWGLENGYTFLPLTTTSPDFHHTVYN